MYAINEHMNCEHDRLLPNPALPDIEGWVSERLNC